MQTLTTTEKGKNTSSVFLPKSKHQPFFAPLRVQPNQNLGSVNDLSEHETDNKADPGRKSSKTISDPIPSSPGINKVKTYQNNITKNFSATIRRVDEPIESKSHFASHTESDSLAKGGGEPLLIEKEEGMLSISESDSIAAPSVTYSPVISHSATPPGADEFGVTITNPTVSGIAVAADATAHVFNVTATLNNSISWSVQSLGRTNIPNENAAAITAANYATVASDLTPDMTSDNGRPPRTQFWAEDLTSQHEQYHANERATTYGNPAFTFAVNWLTAQTASTVAEATTLVNRLPGKMHESYAASYSPGKESRAYGNGAPSYLARATAISTKGSTGGYAAPAPPRAPGP